MITETASAGLYKEPGTPARLFVYAFAALSPLLTLGVIVAPAAALVRLDGSSEIVAASAAGVGWALLLGLGVRRARRLASRFTPPLPLPGDLWNIGVPQPPRRSSNWPIRLRRRTPQGGSTLRRAA